MRNKYDVSLTDNEKEQLTANIKEIVNYLKDLVKPFGTQTKLNAEWSYYDTIWGNHTCEIEIERTFRYKGVWGDSEKEWFTRISGRTGCRYFGFGEEEKIDQEYALSLLDNWKKIKQDINAQIEQREKARQLLVGFEL